jgi:hypothetical protein
MNRNAGCAQPAFLVEIATVSGEFIAVVPGATDCKAILFE